VGYRSPPEEFMGEDGKGLELMKTIEKAKREEEGDKREKIVIGNIVI